MDRRHFNNLLEAVSTTGRVWGQFGGCELMPAALQWCHHPGSSWTLEHRGVSWGGQTSGRKVKDKSVCAPDVEQVQEWHRDREMPSQPEMSAACWGDS